MLSCQDFKTFIIYLDVTCTSSLNKNFNMTSTSQTILPCIPTVIPEKEKHSELTLFFD
jgi:hypothetical protein